MLPFGSYFGTSKNPNCDYLYNLAGESVRYNVFTGVRSKNGDILIESMALDLKHGCF